MKQYVVLAVAALVVLMMVPGGSLPAFAAGQADPKATGGVGYTAYGLQRYANFDAHQLSTSCTQNLNGQYVLSIDSGLYVHDMTITGNTAVGDYPSGPGPYTYTWTGTVNVVGNAVTIAITYDSPAVYTTVLTGTIAPDGSMSGTGTNGVTDWTTTSGHATPSCNGKGSFSYSDTNGAFYTVNVDCVNVDGANTWFSGQVVSGNVGVGNWLFAEVHDGGTPGRNGDQIWGSFTGSNPCLSVAQEGTPSDGPFAISSGNLVVHK